MPHSTQLIPQWSTQRWACAIIPGRPGSESPSQNTGMTGDPDGHPARLITFRRPSAGDLLLLTSPGRWGGPFGWLPVK